MNREKRSWVGYSLLMPELLIAPVLAVAALLILLVIGALLVAAVLTRGRACLKQGSGTYSLIHGDAEEAVAQSMLSLGWSVREVEPGRVAARTSMSWQSFGEGVEVLLEPRAGSYGVEVQSWSRLPTTLVDWGKNKQNVEDLLEALSRRSKEAPPQIQKETLRCPYCHSGVGTRDAVACTECTARHHPECWDDHQQCASCGARTRYGAVEKSAGREPPTPLK
jgi:hypothetical protein